MNLPFDFFSAIIKLVWELVIGRTQNKFEQDTWKTYCAHKYRYYITSNVDNDVQNCALRLLISIYNTINQSLLTRSSRRDTSAVWWLTSKLSSSRVVCKSCMNKKYFFMNWCFSIPCYEKILIPIDIIYLDLNFKEIRLQFGQYNNDCN